MFVDWRPDKASITFGIFGARWNVQEAVKMLQSQPRNASDLEVLKYIGILEMLNGVSYSGVDTTVPLICVSIENGLLPIDGWSRIAKAQRENIAKLPAVVLSLEEDRLARINQVGHDNENPGNFRMIGSEWDVGEARKIAANPDQTFDLDVPKYIGLLEMVAENSLTGLDTNDPVICVRYNGIGWLPIDGWSRIAKVRSLRQSTLPAVGLNRTHSNSVRRK